jgi:hypothetical protein
VHCAGLSWEPHSFVYHPGFYAVNELQQRRDGWASKPVTVTRLALHHYGLKSAQEYEAKRGRGSGDGGVKGQAYWNRVEAQSTVTCLDGVAVGRECCSFSAGPAA